MDSERLHFLMKDWERVHDSMWEEASRPDLFRLYFKTRKLLTFPNLEEWRLYLLLLATLYVLFLGYIYRRHYLHVQRSLQPKVLQNVLTAAEFAAIKNYQLEEIKFKFIEAVYNLVLIFIIVGCEVLPRLWTTFDKFIYMNYSTLHLASYQNMFEHDILLPSYYLACALLWCVLWLPVSYYESCILTDGPPKFEISTRQQWLKKLLKFQWGVAWKVFMIIWLEEGDSILNVNACYHREFETMRDAAVMYTVWLAIVLPLVPARFFNLFPMREGKTKRALEKLADDLHFRLGNIYTFKGGEDESIKISGVFWRRNVSIPIEILDKCDSEEVVALAALEMGDWKHNPLQQIVVYVWFRLLYIIPIAVLHFNWVPLLNSFGFRTKQSRHPLQILVLILGGALTPILHAITTAVYAIQQYFEWKARTLAVKRGYGERLARARIKLRGGKIPIVVGDRMYARTFWGTGDLFSDTLKMYGWTGDETMDEKKEKSDHWEMA